jgi:ribosomal protein S18 acetylase RimI-like enzyme/heme-degrading monooxygenase HmoA
LVQAKEHKVNRRPYQGDRDLELLQDFNAAAIAVTDHCGYLHPGDIPHHLFSGNKYYDPAEVMTIWQDEQGVAAWVLAGPRHKSCDIQLRPDLRGSGFEREVLAYSEARLLALMVAYQIESDCIYADAFQCDQDRARLLLESGWELQNRGNYVLNRIQLDEIAQPILPEGYWIRSGRGVAEAAELAGVHVASFGSNWTAETYRKVIESPGYVPELEYVVVAPDGTLAAFTVTWHDPLNRIGSFEPVGTHKDYRRLGLGRALLMYGMQQMAAAGLQYATVANFKDNEAASGLYTACGFRPWYRLDDYSKPVTI